MRSAMSSIACLSSVRSSASGVCGDVRALWHAIAQPEEVYGPTDALHQALPLQQVLQDERIDLLPHSDDLAHRLVDDDVRVSEEIRRLELVDDLVEQVRLHEDRPEDGALGLGQLVGGRPDEPSEFRVGRRDALDQQIAYPHDAGRAVTKVRRQEARPMLPSSSSSLHPRNRTIASLIGQGADRRRPLAGLLEAIQHDERHRAGPKVLD